MPTTLTLKNIPDAVYDRLKLSEETHRCSMNGEAMVCLEAVLLPSKVTPRECLPRGDTHGDNSPAVASWGVAMLIGLLQAGCTTVMVHSEGDVVVKRHLGVVQILVDDQRTTGIALSSLGITLLPGTLTLGWTDWKAVVVGRENADRCLFVDFSPHPFAKD